MSAYVMYEYHAYHRLTPHATQPLPAVTANGRPYQHRNDGLVENGNYLNNYLCHDEMAIAWPLRSHVP